MPSLSPDAVHEAVSQPGGPLLLDVRSEREFATGRVPGARNIPYDELKGRLDEIAAYRDRGVITYCERGGRASVANQILRDAGFADVAHLQGDMSRWRAEGRPVETTAPAPAP